jgi:hypothetical protein
MSDERVFLTVDEAVAMLPDDETIHTYVTGGPCLIGADWDRSEIVSLLNNAPEKGIELAGEMATAMGHRLAVLQMHPATNGHYVFIETKDA